MAESIAGTSKSLETWLAGQYEENLERFGNMWCHSIVLEQIQMNVSSNFGNVSKKAIGQAIKTQFRNCKVMKYRGKNHVFGLKEKLIVISESNEQKGEEIGNDYTRFQSTQDSEFTERKNYFEPVSHNEEEDPGCISAAVQTDFEEEEIPEELFKTLPRQFFINPALLDASNEVVLGEGTFGLVRKMNFKGMEVAVKEFKEESHYSLSSMKRRILNEAKTLLNIPAHEGIPLVIGVSLAKRPYKLITQLCTYHGKCITLLKVLRKNPNMFSSEEWVMIFEMLSSTLSHIHSAGFLHNDVKSDNIVFIRHEKRWIPVIIDYSESCRVHSATGRSFKHSHDYIEPGILAGDPPSFRSDIYSLARLMNKVLSVIQIDDPYKNMLLSIISKCTSAEDRPDAKSLSKMLANILKKD